MRRWPVGFLCFCPPMKWRTKPLLSCSKSAIVPRGILLNHTLAAPFNVVRNALQITLSGVICNSISVLNDSMWSKGSLEPSYDSNCGRRNFGGKGRFSTLVVNGESVLWIIPSKFSPPLSFMALLNSSISFLILRSSFSIWEESFLEILSCPLAWEFDSSSLLCPSSLLSCSSSFWFFTIHWCSRFWDSIVFCSSSFWWVNSSTLARRAWICGYCTASGCCAASGSISYFEKLFCHWERWLEWLAIPTDNAKLMMQKISSWAPHCSGWTKLWLWSSLLEENLQNELGGKVTCLYGVSQTDSNV